MGLFSKEQQIYDGAVAYLERIKHGEPCDPGVFGDLVKEYGRLLKQFRTVTKIHDKTTDDLYTNRLELIEQINCDALTGIYSRRFLEDNLRRVIRTLARSKGVLSVLMIDVDLFKSYNDTYGHEAGDVCLKSIAQAMTSCMQRGDDFVARYGGEEFLAVLPNTDKDGAGYVANKLLQRVHDLKITHEASEHEGIVTISVGGATGCPEYTRSSGEFIRRADEALYLSKQAGRNRLTQLDIPQAKG